MHPNKRPEWFAIQTRNGLEDMAARTIATLGVETFLPLTRAASRGSARARMIRPLFPCYCFAQFHAALHLRAVRYSRGVLRVVGTGETPWPVEDFIIESIRERLDAGGVAELKSVELSPGQRVRICDGPLEGWTGIFDSELSDHLRVAILLESIRQAKVVVARESLELAAAV